MVNKCGPKIRFADGHKYVRTTSMGDVVVPRDFCVGDEAITKSVGPRVIRLTPADDRVTA